jgi:ABC-type multidrug transport system fused ATPase/permease subunit
MASDRIAPENSEERLIYYALVGSWGWYSIGALYVVGPVLAALLIGRYVWRRYAAGWRPETSIPPPIPIGVWVWIIGMLAMLLALLVAHVGEDLGIGQTLKSTMGWLKGWALLAMFPLAGACLRIRPQVLIRASSWFAVQTLAIMPILVMAALLHLPSRLFVSPLQMIGGPGSEFFSVYLYIVDPSNGSLRWQFIAPWAPAAGMLGDMMFVLACFERNRALQVIGMVTAVLICLMTKSHMAMLFLVVYPPLLWTLARLAKPAMLACGAVVSVVAGALAGPAIDAIQTGVAAFRSARADSTRVREALGRIAVDRWWDEAPIWGHGIVQRGPHHVEFMPIGSHHTWFGLLFVKGLVGLLSLALPLAWTGVEMILLAQVSKLGRLGLAMTFLIVFYSFGKNLEILAYLFWPGLIVLGCAFAEAAMRYLPDAAGMTSGLNGAISPVT